MMKKNVRCMMETLIVVVILCGLSGCSIKGNGDTGRRENGAEDKQIVAQDISGEAEETDLSEESGEVEEAASGEDLDVVVPSAADDDWYMKWNVYTDEKGNRLEVFFDDEGMIEFAVNGLSMYYTTVDNFQQENNWKIYICDDGTMIGYFPGEPAHLEISDGDYAGIYECVSDKDN